ncbi:glycosyltransferase [Parabacteroides sp. PF5-9]|uniref:CgeB family protein n=1 Tax=Parabacteroides sp. PF5-9 TaxID=1742404 RepID=UPI002475E0F2|nr:glycosyltransferase [Parabacteroides sp. PF5-9]MDH6358708.1 spore maturation protein CgeB [Parabacteroides sp. PF5-9]
MKKVLIIGPSFFYYNQSIAHAFEALGFTTQIVPYDEPVHPFSWKNALIHKISRNKEKIKQKSRLHFNASIRKIFDSFMPDLVFIYNGDILEPETITYFKGRAKVAIWLLDALYRYQRSAALAPFVDAYFCFEQTDVDILEQKGIKAYFLPQACDTSIYHPLHISKDTDILFVGTLYGYPKRIEYLKAIVDAFPTKRIEVYGTYKPIYKNPMKWLFREKRSIFKNKNISPQEVNLHYNKAKICINIHHEQSTNGANPKVFEIAGAKCFQLVDYNPYIESIFSQKGIVMYHNKEELIRQIEHYLHADTSLYSEHCYQEVINNHTFINRIKKVLEIID